MSERITTFCDICNLEQSRDTIQVESFCDSPESVCIKAFGWKRMPNGDIKCPACLEEEA